MYTTAHPHWKLIWIRRKFAVLSAVGVLGTLLIGVIGIWPQVQAILELQTQLERAQPRQQSLQRKAISLDSIQSSSEFAQVQVVERALPSKKPLLELLGALSEIAIQSQVSVDSFEIQPGAIATSSAEATRSKDDVDFLELEFTVTGQLDAIRQFTRSIEQMAPFTTVTSFQIANQRQLSSQAQKPVTAQIMTQTFFFTGEVSSKVDSALPVLSDTDREVLAQIATFQSTTVPTQTQIQGGVEDLFGIQALQFQTGEITTPLSIENPRVFVPTSTPSATQPVQQ